MSIEVFNESGQGVNEESSTDIVRYVLGRLDMHPTAKLNIHTVDLKTIEDLHVRWLDLPDPMDVMSFSMNEFIPGSGQPDTASSGSAILDDIVLCPELVAGQTECADHPLNHGLVLLTVYGVLHLLDHNHVTAGEKRQMFSLQNSLLANWHDDIDRRGVSFFKKPTNSNAFPEYSNGR